MFSKMQLARRAQEGVWGGNAHALAFWGGADLLLSLALPPTAQKLAELLKNDCQID